jgi:hypothetical protein
MQVHSKAVQKRGRAGISIVACGDDCHVIADTFAEVGLG